MDWINVFLIIFTLLVLIVSVVSAVYFWQLYRRGDVNIRSGTSLTLVIINAVIAVMAVVFLIWALYNVFSSSPTTRVVVPTTGGSYVAPGTVEGCPLVRKGGCPTGASQVVVGSPVPSSRYNILASPGSLML
nr:hypothetical protein pmam_92 [Pithovirus mammoth]